MGVGKRKEEEEEQRHRRSDNKASLASQDEALIQAVASTEPIYVTFKLFLYFYILQSQKTWFYCAFYGLLTRLNGDC